MTTKTPIYYHPVQHATHDWISIQKIPVFVAQSGRTPVTFAPFTNEDFALAHNPAFVEGIFGMRTRNGFGTKDESINKALRYSSASLWAAVDGVLRPGNGAPTDSPPIACSATQGFHHACYASAGGFCTFNGLIIASRKALAAYPLIGRVLIIDGDGHYGNGTDDIIRKLHLGEQVINITRDEIGEGGKGGTHSRFTEPDWNRWTADLIGRHKPGLVIFQSGGDAWDEDPFGAGYLSKAALADRDAGVMTAAQSAGIPLVWNLAGGYADPMQLTIDLHLQTLGISDRILAQAGTLTALPGATTAEGRRGS